MVDNRNESAHPNGNIFFSTQAALDLKIREILRVVEEIQTHYLSQKDSGICATFDIASRFSTYTNYSGVESLHQTLLQQYPNP